VKIEGARQNKKGLMCGLRKVMMGEKVASATKKKKYRLSRKSGQDLGAKGKHSGTGDKKKFFPWQLCLTKFAKRKTVTKENN